MSPKFAQEDLSKRKSLSPLKSTRGRLIIGSKNRLDYQNGDLYLGEIQNNVRNGYGILKDKEGDELYVGNNLIKIKGYWVNDGCHGSGMTKNKQAQLNIHIDYKDIKILNSNWLHYSGQFVNNIFSGIGNILFSNKDRY